MTITIETHIDDAAVAKFYGLYAKAFTPMQARAAARHLLTGEEFAEEMADKRIEKYVAWDHDGEPTALLTFTADLSAVPWISPAFYAARYPQETARGAVFYLGYTLVDRTRAAAQLFTDLCQALAERLAAAQAVCVYDVCAYNDSRSVGRMTEQLRSMGAADIETLDVQTYYAASFVGKSNPGALR
ncbi:MAG TPA: hypothetical protein VFO77_13580 [Actinoplanes sp.]|nr:hypothetical protein [Actinoplanes sp.]